jgi:signal transduction protein with GAF and PtsI domain
MAVSATEFGRLDDLAVFLATEERLDARLAELARLAADAVETAACSIMLLSEHEDDSPRLRLWASTAALPDAAWQERPGAGESIAGAVLERGRAVLIEDIHSCEFAHLARGREDMGTGFMGVPITVGRAVVGVMNISGRPGGAPFASPDMVRAGIAGMLIGKTVQVDRLQTLLRSRVAQLTLARQEPEVAASLTDGGLPPARLAKVLAKAFYKDLAAAGFGPGQIIEAATEIIGQISGDIARAKTRLARGARKDSR